MCKNYTVFLLFLIVACTGIKETMIKDNQDFIKNAYKFKITSPLSHNNPAFSKYIVEDIKAKKVYDVEPQFEEPERKHFSFAEEDDDFTKTIISYKFFIYNPLDEKTYVITGSRTITRIKEDNKEEIIKNVRGEFQIYEDELNVGEVITMDPQIRDMIQIVIPVKISFHNQKIDLQIQRQLNNKKYTFKEEGELVALFGFDTAEFIATKYSGDVFIKGGMSEEMRSNIITMFIITDIVNSI